MQRARIPEEVDIRIDLLKFGYGDDWLKEYVGKNGNSITIHPLYLALRGDKNPLEQWCTFLKNIWLMERLDLLFDIYKSLIRYGQMHPIIIKRDNTIVTGEKRACCMLIMGKTTIRAQYES